MGKAGGKKINIWPTFREQLHGLQFMEEKNTKLKLANLALNFENSGIKDWKQAHVYGSCEIKESELVTLNWKCGILY